MRGLTGVWRHACVLGEWEEAGEQDGNSKVDVCYMCRVFNGLEPLNVFLAKRGSTAGVVV